MFTHAMVRRLTRSVAAIGLVALGVSVMSPVSGAVASSAHTWKVMVGEESSSGSIQGMQFLPGEIWIDVGDTVQWTANSMEPHTVSFPDADHPAVPFDLTHTYMLTPTPETTISAPGQYRNSGIVATLADDVLPPPASVYRLTFTGPGTYDYICYVHGRAMQGVVHVAPAGTPYPHTQQYYNAEYRAGAAAVIADGEALWSTARAAATRHHVYVGATDDMAMVMRFTRPKVTIKAGETVTFDWGLNRFPVPHTVTIAPEVAPPFVPVGDPSNYQGGPLNSGLLMPSLGGPATWSVTFTKAGTYHYFCAFHDGMGMVGTVVVQ